MTPLEAAIRAACKFMGVDADHHDGGWRNFADVGRVAAEAFVDAFPPELRACVRHFLDKETTP